MPLKFLNISRGQGVCLSPPARRTAVHLSVCYSEWTPTVIVDRKSLSAGAGNP